MTVWKSADEVLAYAMEREEEAAAFYRDLANRAPGAGMREIFEEFAREEDGHKAKLAEVRRGGSDLPLPLPVADLRIEEYLVDAQVTPRMNYQELLIAAMKKEKAAFKLYTDLAALCDDNAIQSLLLRLAQEEAKHKLRFEIEYDQNVLSED